MIQLAKFVEAGKFTFPADRPDVGESGPSPTRPAMHFPSFILVPDVANMCPLM